MSDRIARQFARAKAENRAALVSYVCAGDPNYATSLAACRSLLANGTDVLELGLPFSDPLADGLTNQLAADRALKAGMTLDQSFQLAKELRAEFEQPLIFFTYYNLVFARGEEQFLQDAAAAGVDGLLVLDLPPEEADTLVQIARKLDLATVFLVAPTTPPERMSLIAEVARGFIYYVSREGVTGVQDSVASNLAERMQMIRAHTDLPIAVGFGISNSEQVREVAKHADGVVVGSALVNTIARNAASSEAVAAALATQAQELCSGLQH
jgi:tryptophan synthase alpha chain